MSIDRKELEMLLALSESELICEVGAQLMGFSSFNQGLALSVTETDALQLAGEGLFKNQNHLGLSNETVRMAWQKTLDFADKCQGKVGEYFEEKHDQLFEVVCIKFDYCAKIKQSGDTIEIAVQLAAFLETVLVGLPITQLTAYLVKRGLDSFCHCD